MNYRSKILVSFGLLCGILSDVWRIAAQEIPLNTWRTHAAYQPAHTLALAGRRVWCASPNGLWYYDRDTQEIQPITKLDGLSEALIRTIAYHPPSQTLVIAYENSTIDLLQPQGISSITTLRDLNTVSSRRINHITFGANNISYISTDFGVVLIDLSRRQVREAYQNLAADGSPLAINAAALSPDSLYLATANGVIGGALRDNLLDFRVWRRFGIAQGIGTQAAQDIAYAHGRLYALQNGIGIAQYDFQGRWLPFPLPGNQFHNLDAANDQLLVSATARVYRVSNTQSIQTLADELIANPRQATLDNTQRLWIADGQNGLIGNAFGNAFASYTPNGVAQNRNFRLYHFPGQNILALAGGYDTRNGQALQQAAEYYQFKDNIWQNWNSYDPRFSRPLPAGTRDASAAAVDARNGNLYLALYGMGILVQKPDNAFEMWNATTPGTTLRNNANGQILVSDVLADATGNAWVSVLTLGSSEPPLHLRRADGTWRSFAAINFAASAPLEMLQDQRGYLWIRLASFAGGGIWVIDPAGNRSRYLSNIPNEGNLPSNNVTAIAQDLAGAMWIGTDRGVTVISNPARVFEGNVNAFTPILESRPLLRTETITSIAIDGGNRKWIGTRTGAWLFSPGGNEQILYFNTDNSPMPSNEVQDMVIQPKSGEVFVMTSGGIASFRGTATIASADFGAVKVFPNPVRPNFAGTVGISGLTENAYVKITDTAGRLFYETRAQGGTATWNLRDYQNTPATTGIYLIFATDELGNQTYVGKIAVVE